MKKSRVAFLTPFSPHRADSGGTQVSLQRLKALCEVADVDVFSLYDVSEAREALRAQAPIHELYQAGSLRGRNLVNFLRSVVSGLPLSVWRNSEPTFLRMAELHGTEVYDVIYIDHWLMWSAAKHFTAAKRRILHLHNAEHLLFSRAKEGKSALLRGVLSWEASRAAAFLVKIAAACDETHFLSPVDQAALIKLGVRENTTRAFFPAVDVQAEEFGKFGKNLLFAGTLSWLPNIEGIEWFLRQCLPHLPADYQTTIIGGPQSAINFPIHKSSSVNFAGHVASVDPYYRSTSIFIAPLLSGSGIKLKIINALAHGLPVITTPVGVEGFPDDWGPSIRVASTPQEFVRNIQELCGNSSAWKEATSGAKEYVKRHFSASVFAKWAKNVVSQ